MPETNSPSASPSCLPSTSTHSPGELAANQVANLNGMAAVGQAHKFEDPLAFGPFEEFPEESSLYDLLSNEVFTPTIANSYDDDTDFLQRLADAAEQAARDEQQQMGTFRVKIEEITDDMDDCKPIISTANHVQLHPPITGFPPPVPGVPMKKYKNVRKSNCFHCVVCGDKPTGYHYDVLSCNGCKTFFRRTVIAGRTFKCSKGGNCSFNKDFRCACRCCRFNKCVQAGMNPQAIQWPSGIVKRETFSSSDDEDDATIPFKEVKQEMNGTTSTELVARVPPPLSDVFIAVSGLIQSLMTREMKAIELRERWSMFSNHSLAEILQSPCLLGLTQPQTRLKERTDYLRLLYSDNPIKFWMVSDLILIAEYAKSFSAFRELSLRDQRALLSHVGPLLLVLGQSFYSKAKNQGTTTFPDGIVALDAVDSNKCSVALRREYTPWIGELFSEPVELLRKNGVDRAVFALLRAISLFSPMDEEISAEGRVIIQKQRERLMDALSRLLFSKEGGGPTGAPSRMSSLLSIVQKLFLLSEKRRLHFTVFDLSGRVHFSAIGNEIYLRRREQR